MSGERNNSYGWVICAAGTIILCISIGLLANAFPNYFPFIREERGFSNTEVAFITTARTISSIICMFLVDRYYAKLDLKLGLGIAMAFATVSHLIFSTAATPAGFYLGSVCAGFGYGLGGMIPVSMLIKRWFPDHFGTPLGIASAGTGVGAIIGPPVITWMVHHVGISAGFRIEAVFIAVLGFTAVALVRNRPAGGPSDGKGEKEPAGSGGKEGAADDAGGKQIPREGIKGADRARVLVSMAIMGTLSLTVAACLPLIYSTGGHPMEEVSMWLSFTGVMMVIGKIALGAVADRIGNYRTVALFLIMMAAGDFFFIFAYRPEKWLAFLAFLLGGVGSAASSIGISLMAGDFCGEGAFARELKTYQLTYVIGGLATSAVPGIFADMTGSYVPGTILFFGCAVVLLVLLLPVYRRREKALREMRKAASRKMT